MAGLQSGIKGLAVRLRICKHCLQQHYARRYVANFKFNLKEGIPHDVKSLLWGEYDTDTLRFWLMKRRIKKFYDGQKYSLEKHKSLGPDLATAYLMLSYGASVKFWDVDTWIRPSADDRHNLPTSWVSGLHLEGIDASGTDLAYPAMENFKELEYLTYLNVSSCPHVDDWFLARSYLLRDSLQILDVSNCRSITENGLACLHHLRNLRVLNVANLPQIEYKDSTFMLMEEMLPQCALLGIGFLPRGPDIQYQKLSYESPKMVESPTTTVLGTTVRLIESTHDDEESRKTAASAV